MSEAAATAREQHWVGLDGLRGVAVAGVLLYHGGFDAARGGFLGVSLFFTLSGFLITTIVVREREATGGISLSGFWARRARRLIPASLLALALATVTTIFIIPDGQAPAALADIRAAALNFVNWRFIWEGAPYADIGALPSPVQHYWSLAIEEQFYLLFPVLALLATRRRPERLALALGAIVVLATWRQLALDDQARVYFGTDTRIAEIAVGGLLALLRPRLLPLLGGRLARLPDVVGGLGLAATALLWWRVDLGTGGLYAGGFTLLAVVSSLVILGAVDGDVVRRVLSSRPLVQLGVVSYGVYLFHFPLFLLLAPPRVDLAPTPLFALRVAVTLVVSVLSFRLVERPVRLGARLRGQRATVAFAGSLALLVLAAGAGIQHYGAPSTTGLAALEVAVGPTVTSQGSPPTSDDGDPAASTTSSTVAAAGAGGRSPSSPPTTAPPPARPPHVVVVGDSTAAGLARGLRQWGADTGRLRVTSVSSPGCATYSGTEFRVREGYIFTPKGCEALFSGAVALATAEKADAFVVFIGSSQLADWRYAGRSGWHDLQEPIVTSEYRATLAAALTELEGAGIPVLWADVPTPDWDLDEFSALVGSGAAPGAGPVTMNDPDRTATLNALTSAVVATHPETVVFPWASHLAGPDGTIPEDMRADGLHISEDRIPEIAERWLMDLLDQSYDEVVARSPAGLVPPADHTWSR